MKKACLIGCVHYPGPPETLCNVEIVPKCVYSRDLVLQSPQLGVRESRESLEACELSLTWHLELSLCGIPSRTWKWMWHWAGPKDSFAHLGLFAGTCFCIWIIGWERCELIGCLILLAQLWRCHKHLQGLNFPRMVLTDGRKMRRHSIGFFMLENHFK